MLGIQKPKRSRCMMRKRISLFNSYVFIFPSLFLTLALGIYPIVWALRYMFYDYQGFGQEKFIGLDNFSRLLRDQEFWHSVYNTLHLRGRKNYHRPADFTFTCRHFKSGAESQGPVCVPSILCQPLSVHRSCRSCSLPFSIRITDCSINF